MSDERDGVASDPDGPDVTDESPTASSPADGVDGTDPGSSAGADQRSRRGSAAARPTGKRRTVAATGPGRSVPAAEGSKRAGNRPTARRSVAEAPARQGIVARIGRFLREVVAELRKVIWPTRKELVTYTTVVLAFVTFMVALVAGLDLLFARGVLAVFG